MTSDSAKEVLFSARSAKSQHIVIVNKDAGSAAAVLKALRQKSGQTKQTEEETDNLGSLIALRALLRRFKTTEDKLVVQSFFRKSRENVCRFSILCFFMLIFLTI